MRHALQLARWDLERDYEAIDRFHKDHAADSARDFVWRYLTEAAFEIMEHTENRVSRRDLGHCLTLLERMLG